MSTMPDAPEAGDFRARDYLAPRYWPTWAGLGLLRLLIRLPDPALRALATGLGHLGYHLMPQRRRITRTNIDRCFPELDKAARRRLVRESFTSAILAVFESAIAWWAPDARLRNRYTLEGKEHLEQALAAGKGAILLGGHYTTLEISGRLLGYEVPNVWPTYKRAHNPLVEALMYRARSRNNAGLIPSKDIRRIVRRLRAGDVVWIAPDQDFGLSRSVFAPFMGIEASTLTVIERLANMSGAPVLPYYSRREGDHYRLRIAPPLKNFPSGDSVTDATAVNAAIETGVREAPGQYLWGHARFKTRRRGEPQFYRARRDRRLRRYSRLLLLISLPATGWTLWQAFRHRDMRHARQRLGLGPFPPGPFDHWFHAASVGEVNAVAPLMERLHQRWPHARLLLTVNTPSGKQTAERRLGETAAIAYLPLDWQFAVRRFFDATRPRNSLVVETELWPNLFLEAHYRGAPVTIVNGRLSRRTLEAPVFVRAILQRTLESVFAVLARSQADADHYLGWSRFLEGHVDVVGNLKFAAAPRQPVTPFDAGRPYILAASTRPGEEQRLARLWQQLETDHLLVIVPRHPKRLKAILSDLAPGGLPVAVRSRNERITEATRIYLADTFGELPAFIAGSRFVIMGGSLEPFGGQNILEAAAAGKAVIFGPHMDNFADEARLFLEREAGRQVTDDAALQESVRELLAHPERAEAMGRQGRNLMTEMSDMADRYLERLEARLPRFRPAPPNDSR